MTERIEFIAGENVELLADGSNKSIIIKSNKNSVHGIAVFNTPGTYLWIVPLGVTSIYVSGCGGGAGGSNATNPYSESGRQQGCGGSSGASIIKERYTVNPNSTHTIVIASGGAAGSGSNGIGAAGGTTSISGIVTLPGGPRASHSYTGSSTCASPNGMIINASNMAKGADSLFGSGGSIDYGDGSAGMIAGPSGYGSGGGGGLRNSLSSNRWQSTAGKGGLIIIEY